MLGQSSYPYALPGDREEYLDSPNYLSRIGKRGTLGQSSYPNALPGIDRNT